jgi:hypothetical protein
LILNSLEEGSESFVELVSTCNPEGSPRSATSERISSVSPDSLAHASAAVWLQGLRKTVAAASGVSESVAARREADDDASAAYSDAANVLMATGRLRRKAAGTTDSVESVPAG